jgi:cold shock CspA family protein
MASTTSTLIWMNQKPVTSIVLGGIKDTDIIDMHITFQFFPFVISKTGKEIKEKGGNVFFDRFEPIGQGLVRRHTIGLIRIGYSWRFEKTESDIQFYKHQGGLFTSSLIHQKEALESMKTLIVDDPNIPDYSSYQEFAPENGSVIWFDPFRLIGAIASEGGNVFFHWNDVRSGYKHGCLKPGTKVIFSAVPSTGAFPLKAAYVIK